MLLHQINKAKKIFPVCLTMILLILIMTSNVNGIEDNVTINSDPEKKVIVLLLDGLSLNDLENYQNLRTLAHSAGLGLINTRTQSLTAINRASNYLTMGMGVRIQVEEPVNGYKIKQEPPTGEGRKSTLGKIHNLDAGALNELVAREYPNYTLGKIGELARVHGVTLALVGNADTDRPNNDSTLLVMDKSGVIDWGNISPSLLTKAPDFAWGVKTDSTKLLTSTLEAVKISDVTFVDFGDTARVGAAAKRYSYDQKELQSFKDRALANADFFLGRLLNSVDLNHTVLIIASPTPPVNESSRINNSLAPIMIYEKNHPPGLLTSNTTMRDGLAANIDFGPTVFDRLGFNSKKMSFLGEKMTTSVSLQNFAAISRNLSQYTTMKASRYLVHGIYVTLIVLSLIYLYLTAFGWRKVVGGRTARALALMVIAWPAVIFVVMAAAQVQTYYINLILAGLITVGLGLLLSKTTDRCLAGMGWLSLITALFLIGDTLTGLRFLLNTPLGFNDVFSGGRYYGINNDCMGILLGSTVYAMFYFFHKASLSRPLTTVVGTGVLLTVVLTQTPGFGANVGGTIAAMTTGVVALLVLAFDRPLQKGRVLVTVLVVFIIELGIAYFDYRNGTQTHAGKVLGALLSQGIGPKFLEVLKSKLGLFAVMLVLPPWNILFGAELYACYLFRNRMPGIMEYVKQAYPAQFNSFEVIFYSGLVAFAFNDTGIIATAIIFTYLTMPLTSLLSANTEAVCNNKNTAL